MPSIEERLAACEAFIASLKGVLGGTDSAGGGVASDRELDGPNGDPVIKFEARDWRAPPSFIGKKLSQATPEYLEFMADGDEEYARYLRSTPDSNPKKKNAPHKDKSARLCRGWAKRMRDEGWTAPPAPEKPANPWATKKPEPAPQPAETEQVDDDEIPF